MLTVPVAWEMSNLALVPGPDRTINAHGAGRQGCVEPGVRTSER